MSSGEDERIIGSYRPSMEALLGVKGIRATGLAWMAVHGNLCLALRHPENVGEARDLVVDFVKRLGRLLVEWGVMTEEQIRYTERVEADEGSTDICPVRSER